MLANPAYRRLFAAQTISRWGDTFNLVALVVLVFRLTGSGLGVSGAVVPEILPVLLLAPLAGVVVDRLPRVRVMVAADLWRMTLAGMLPLADQHLAAVYAVAFGLAAGSVVFNPAAASVLPSVVADDELVAANSGLWSAAVISQIALAPLAGSLVTAWGVTPAFWVNAASFAVSAAALARAAAAATAGSGGRRPLAAAARRRRPPAHPASRCCGCWPSPSCWPPCRPGPPAPCWWCWPAGAWASKWTALGCCWPPSASARLPARYCWPG